MAGWPVRRTVAGGHGNALELLVSCKTQHQLLREHAGGAPKRVWLAIHRALGRMPRVRGGAVLNDGGRHGVRNQAGWDSSGPRSQ